MRSAAAGYVFWGQLLIALGVSARANADWVPGVPISCQNGGPGLSAPCLSLRARNVLLAPSGDTFALLLNFGLAWPGTTGGKFELLCEEAYASKSPDHALLLDNGAVLMPTLNGLRRTTLGDGCTFTYAEGIPKDAVVVQIVAEKTVPDRIWALTTNAEQRRTLYHSKDGGLSFTTVHAFAPGIVFWTLAVSDSDPTHIVLSGAGSNGPFAIATSNDAGASFTLVDPLPAFADAISGVTMLGISPADPGILFFARATATGPEELWRSRDGGVTAEKLFALQEGEVVSGFTFGSTAQDLFVAGFRLLQTTGVPPAHLYASKDGGNSWRVPIASGDRGPRLRCLHHRKGSLWGCGGEASEGDAFLLGRSFDGGVSWNAVVDVPRLSPLKACTAALCPATDDWLCNTYGLCATKKAPSQKSTGGCSMPQAYDRRSAAVTVVLIGLAIVFIRRRRR